METLDLKKKVCAVIDGQHDRICEIGRSIYHHPELGYKEKFASEQVRRYFDELGLDHEDGLAVTGVKARLKKPGEGVNVALLGELDAVVCPEHPDADPVTGAAHCCGHFGQIAVLLAAATGLCAVRRELEGNVTFFATPAEECVELEYRRELMNRGVIHYLGGKQELLHMGAFNDVDMALMVHGNDCTDSIVAAADSVGFIAKQIRFTGREAHAGGAPWMGINALNAASLAIMAINSIRETLQDKDCIRIHPIITKGGTLVNIVPDDVRMEMYVRGATIEAMKDANEKVNRAVRGAAYAIGASVEITELPGYLPVRLDQNLCRVFGDNAAQLFPDRKILYVQEMGGGSSDIGDLANVMPCLQGGMGGFANGFHTKEFRLVNEDMAFIEPAKVLACSVIDLLADNGRKAHEILDSFQSPYTARTYDRIWESLLSKAEAAPETI